MRDTSCTGEAWSLNNCTPKIRTQSKNIMSLEICKYVVETRMLPKCLMIIET